MRWISSWFGNQWLRNAFFAGFAVGVAYKALLWHVFLGLTVTEAVQGSPVAYIIQYFTGGILAGFAAMIGAYYAARGDH